MKLQEPKQVKVGEYNFYIRPFSAFKAASISADVMQVIVPIIGAIIPALNFSDADEILDSKVEDLAPQLTKGFAGLTGEKFESLLRTLLISGNNIAVDFDGETVPLSEDILNEIFCFDIQYMYVLAFHVIITNYSGFFKRLGLQSGKLTELLNKAKAKFQSTES